MAESSLRVKRIWVGTPAGLIATRASRLSPIFSQLTIPSMIAACSRCIDLASKLNRTAPRLNRAEQWARAFYRLVAARPSGYTLERAGEPTRSICRSELGCYHGNQSGCRLV